MSVNHLLKKKSENGQKLKRLIKSGKICKNPLFLKNHKNNINN